MKNLLVIGFALFSAFSASSNEWHKACESTGMLAKTMMMARQSGVPLEKAMKKLMKFYPKADLLLLDAYNRPVFSTEKYQQMAIKEFKNDVLLECYKEFSNNKSHG